MTVRVVSLVPSATETLVALGVAPVACTRFCDRPGTSTVGGTKDPDVGAVVALEPDLVVVNDEENRREDADALRAAGLTLHSMSPRAVADVPAAVDGLADRVGVPPPRLTVPAAVPPVGSSVAFVWRRPWMVQANDTYGASVLAHLGWPSVGMPGTDRYPRVALADVAALAPDLVVLPSEPYPFGPRHVPAIAEALPGSRVALVDGRDLYWWGIRTPAALGRLARTLGG